MPDALVERERAKRDWCKVARFNYGMDAVGAPDNLPYVTPKPVLHALTERGEGGSSSVGMPQGTIFAD